MMKLSRLKLLENIIIIRRRRSRSRKKNKNVLEIQVPHCFSGKLLPGEPQIIHFARLTPLRLTSALVLKKMKKKEGTSDIFNTFTNHICHNWKKYSIKSIPEFLKSYLCSASTYKCQVWNCANIINCVVIILSPIPQYTIISNISSFKLDICKQKLSSDNTLRSLTLYLYYEQDPHLNWQKQNIYFKFWQMSWTYEC